MTLTFGIIILLFPFYKMGYLSNKYIFRNVNLKAEPFLEINSLLAHLKLCIKTLIVML